MSGKQSRRRRSLTHSEKVAIGNWANEHILTGETDTMLIPCPKCGGQLRSEIRAEDRPIEQVWAIFGRGAFPEVAPGSLIRVGVPYVTCMHCGFDTAASLADRPAAGHGAGWVS